VLITATADELAVFSTINALHIVRACVADILWGFIGRIVETVRQCVSLRFDCRGCHFTARLFVNMIELCVENQNCV
jgi:hypothetical protein